MALGRLTPARVDAAIARWIREGSGPAVVLGRYRLLHSAITWAMHEQYLRSDPLAGHRAPRAPLPRKHLRPALGRRLIEEAERLAEKAGAAFGERPGSRRLLLAAFRAAQTALLVRLVADTGARLGELAAMQVGDLEDVGLRSSALPRDEASSGRRRPTAGERSPSDRQWPRAGWPTSTHGDPTLLRHRGCSHRHPRATRPWACRG